MQVSLPTLSSGMTCILHSVDSVPLSLDFCFLKCPSFISFAVIKYHNKKQLTGEKGALFQFTIPGSSPSFQGNQGVRRHVDRQEQRNKGIFICTWSAFSILIQSSILSLGNGATMVVLVLAHQLTKSRQSLIDIPTDQPYLDNPLLRYFSQVILDCGKLALITTITGWDLRKYYAWVYHWKVLPSRTQREKESKLRLLAILAHPCCPCPSIKVVLWYPRNPQIVGRPCRQLQSWYSHLQCAIRPLCLLHP